MAELTLKLLGSSDFNPEKYVRELSQNCVGGQELVRLRAKIYNLSEDTNNTLKKNVYQNYMQFIDTAKEISHLESEMYQLSHLLSEHKNLLNSVSSVSILDDNVQLRSEQDFNAKDENEEQTTNKQKISTIIEKVEGCVNFSEESTPLFLHDDDILEIDSIESTPLRRIHAYLFSEGLMITTWNANRRGPMRYKFETFYEIGSLAVVNVRDLGTVKHAFKLLAFPDTRVFQCTSNAAKKEWLDKFDQAKKSRLTQNQVRKDLTSERSPAKTVVDEVEEEIKTHPEWILESSDELEVHIAQRHFEEALNLLHKAKDYLNQYILPNNQSDPVLMDIKC
ncbi:exocyst complex component 8 isoform X2 [Agrilus planipennis]|uniref:Exocyst complex component 8 isoform X2 n=1 Tax=Agrilus planipennis TaxID=224129 RepID=A0A1W4WDG8_AGRPL|nr:exocyst complex component 8 isoform X2 [Agrilus planipennis]